jgi:WhiB family redox-sensing transcriptional regulator
MAAHDFDHQFTRTHSRSVAALASYGRLEAGIPAPRADRASWMLLGACRGEDPELFFPISAAGPSLTQARSAKAICRRCPVQPNCLSYALITQTDGIWGGTTWEERWSDPPPPATATATAPDRPGRGERRTRRPAKRPG